MAFSRSNVCYRKGWFDEAAQEINQACAMAPGNMEYRRMQNVLNNSSVYGGYRPMQQNDAADCCMQLACLNCLMQLLQEAAAVKETRRKTWNENTTIH